MTGKKCASHTFVGGHVEVNSFKYKPVEMYLRPDINYRHVF